MKKLALFGAGGKMGLRLSRNLASSEFLVSHVEVSTDGQDLLRSELNVECVEAGEAVQDADIVVLAVPETVIGKVAASIINNVRSGAMICTPASIA